MVELNRAVQGIALIAFVFSLVGLIAYISVQNVQNGTNGTNGINGTNGTNGINVSDPLKVNKSGDTMTGQLNINGGLWIDGNTGDTPASGAGTRLMWIPSLAAFRAGKVGVYNPANYWDEANIGIGSFSLSDSRAIGLYSFAGAVSDAQGTSSFAWDNSIAYASHCFAVSASTCNGYASVAMAGSQAGADYAVAIGNSIANGYACVAMANAGCGAPYSLAIGPGADVQTVAIGSTAISVNNTGSTFYEWEPHVFSVFGGSYKGNVSKTWGFPYGNLTNTPNDFFNLTNLPDSKDYTNSTNSSMKGYVDAVNSSVFQASKDYTNGTNSSVYNASVQASKDYTNSTNSSVNITSLQSNDTQIPITDFSLIIYYPFNEGIGLSALDHSYYKHDGSLNGFNFNSTSNWVQGIEDSALLFDGVNDYIGVTPNSTLNLTVNSSITISLWINPINLTGEHSLIGTSGGGYLLETSGSGIKWFSYTTSGDTYSTGGVLSKNIWQHIVLRSYNVSTGQQTDIWINGTHVTNTILANRFQSLITAFSVGSYLGARYYNGTMDDVRIWYRALSDDEVYQLYVNTKNKQNSTVVYNNINNTGGVLLNTLYTNSNSKTLLIFATIRFQSSLAGGSGSVFGNVSGNRVSGSIGIESGLLNEDTTQQLVFPVCSNCTYAINSTSTNSVITLEDVRSISI